MNKLQGQYKQNVKVYGYMGLDIPVGLETVRLKLTKHQKEAISKGTGQLVIAPAITEKFTFFDLIGRFDKKQDNKTYIWKELWEQYALTGQATINVISLKADNEFGDPVVQHTNKTLEDQRKIKAEFISPVESLVLMAILRLDGKDLAPNTWIRFPHLSNKQVGGDSVVGYVYSHDGQAVFDGTYGYALWSVGVGVSVGTRILIPETSALPKSFSSGGLAEVTAIRILKEAGYTITKEF